MIIGVRHPKSYKEMEIYLIMASKSILKDGRYKNRIKLKVYLGFCKNFWRTVTYKRNDL